MVNQNQQVVLTAAGLLAIATIVTAVIIYSYVVNLSGSGTIISVTPEIRVYGDAQLTKEISGVSWGEIQVGDQSTVTLWIKNTGNIPLKISFSLNEWAPANAGEYLSISWNYDGAAIQPNAYAAVDLTLSVSPSTVGITTFSNSISITGASG